MVDYKIDPTIPPLSEDEKQDLIEESLNVDENIEKFREDMNKNGIPKFVFSQQAIDEMKKAGITPEEVISMILSKAGKLN